MARLKPCPFKTFYESSFHLCAKSFQPCSWTRPKKKGGQSLPSQKQSYAQNCKCSDICRKRGLPMECWITPAFCPVSLGSRGTAGFDNLYFACAGDGAIFIPACSKVSRPSSS